ncbi:DUF814 domain-containing protein [Coprothermobacteraceae bacterium]|nr:DUF814 domain-containing protein [Coprothermobacteraceae bacterium]
MKIDTVFLNMLAKDLADKYEGKAVRQVSLSGPFIELETAGGPLLISLVQAQPLIGEGTLPQAHKSNKLTQMLNGLLISDIHTVNNDRIVRISFRDRLMIVSRDILVELIPNFAVLVVVENGRILYASRDRGALGRSFIPNTLYQEPNSGGISQPYHPARRQIINSVKETARGLIEKHLNKTDLRYVVVARDLPWPTKHSHRTALDVSNSLIAHQLEAYFSHMAVESQKTVAEHADRLNEQNLLEQAAFLKKCGQALLSAPSSAFSKEFDFVDWDTGNLVKLDLSQYGSFLEAAQHYFEKARRLEKKASHPAQPHTPSKTKLQDRPFKRIEIGGTPVYIGLSARGNEYVTFTSSPRHWWFHVKSGSGAHVVVRSENLTEDLKSAAASIAAFHSSKADNAKVEVVFTKVSNVERHPSNKKGLVIYRDFETMVVRPANEDELLGIV